MLPISPMSKSSFLSVELSNSTIDSLEAYLPQSIKDLAFPLAPTIQRFFSLPSFDLWE
jgi:hypothetical protein